MLLTSKLRQTFEFKVDGVSIMVRPLAKLEVPDELSDDWFFKLLVDDGSFEIEKPEAPKPRKRKKQIVKDEF